MEKNTEMTNATFCHCPIKWCGEGVYALVNGQWTPIFSNASQSQAIAKGLTWDRVYEEEIVFAL